MESTETENLFQVTCFIGQDIKYLHTGIQKVRIAITYRQQTHNCNIDVVIMDITVG